MLILQFVALLYPIIAAEEYPESIPEFKPNTNRRCLMKCTGIYECFEKDEECHTLEKHYDLADNENRKLRQLLIYGHNGLRNRLALKLKACDMLQMSWDDNLADLANRHHDRCNRNVACESRENLTASENVIREYKITAGNSNSSNIARNSYFLEDVYAIKFIELAVGLWYDAHHKLAAPTIVKTRVNKFYKVLGENTFTHIINPSTHRLGCSYAVFVDGLSLICYYFPYTNLNNTVLLRVKPKNYQCPYTFPIFDKDFKGLCKYAKYTHE